MSGTCRDSPNIGHHSVKAPLDIGLPDAGEKTPPILDIAGLPVFTITCKLKEGPLAGKIYKLTDPRRARSLFSHRSAETLRDVLDFYDRRFKIGFTHKDKTDLVNFQNTL